MSGKSTLESALMKAPKDFYDLLGRVIEEQNNRSHELSETIKGLSKEHKEAIDELAKGQVQLAHSMEKLGTNIVNFEERHARDLARIEERHEENRNRFEISERRHEEHDRAFAALADKIQAQSESITAMINIQNGHIIELQKDTESNADFRKMIGKIATGVFISVTGAILVFFVLSGKAAVTKKTEQEPKPAITRKQNND